MTPAEKARALLARGTHGPCAACQLCEHLGFALNAELLKITGDPLRDIEAIQMEVHTDGAIYRGFSGGGVQRLYCLVALEDLTRTVDIVLVATTGGTNADTDLFGASGPEIGNSVLVARLFDIGVSCFHVCGVERVRNKPFDDRVREIYTQMGFVSGELLDLRDAAQLTRAFAFVASAYKRFGLTLVLPP